MERRDFLKLGVFTPLSLSAAEALAVPGVPRTVGALIAWFENTFECEVGPFAACCARGAYRTYALGCHPIDKSEKLLVVSMYSAFAKALREHPEACGTHLTWRLEEKIKYGRYISEIEEDSVGLTGDLVVKVKKRVNALLRFRAHFDFFDDEKYFSVLPEKNPGEKMRETRVVL